LVGRTKVGHESPNSSFGESADSSFDEWGDSRPSLHLGSWSTRRIEEGGVGMWVCVLEGVCLFWLLCYYIVRFLVTFW